MALAMTSGFASGMLTGSAIGIFFLILGVYFNLAFGVGAGLHEKSVGAALFAGLCLGVAISIFNPPGLHSPVLLEIAVLFSGAYVGVLIASIAEIGNVIPMLYWQYPKRSVLWIFAAVFAAGKMVGILLDFLHPVFQ